MTTVYTYVCEDCHAGWNVEAEDDDVARRCRWCGQRGVLRGTYVKKPLHDESENPVL